MHGYFLQVLAACAYLYHFIALNMFGYTSSTLDVLLSTLLFTLDMLKYTSAPQDSKTTHILHNTASTLNRLG